MKIGWVLICAALAGCGRVPESEPNQIEGARAENWVGRPDVADTDVDATSLSEEQAAPVPGNGLCAANETIIFQCRTGRAIVAICAGRLPGRPNYAQYRYGIPGRLELVYPARTDNGPGGLAWARTGYSGGGEMQVRFANEGVDYIVYSRMMRTGFGPDGHNNPRFESGVATARGHRLLADRSCVEPPDPWVDEEQAPSFMPEGEFFAWWDLAG